MIRIYFLSSSINPNGQQEHKHDKIADYEGDVVVVCFDYADASVFDIVDDFAVADYAGLAFVVSHPTMNRIVIYYCCLLEK